jgi:uncharacterized protein YuzE
VTFNYDDDADVLYVTFARPEGRVLYTQTARGDVLRYCDQTGQIVGVTILFFMERSAKGERIEVPEVGIANFSPIMESILAGRSGLSNEY